MKRRIVSAMSGGVDSSVATFILVSQGYQVMGVSMLLSKIEEIGYGERRCCSLDDLIDARRVARKLGIPYTAIDLSTEFTNTVIKPFVEAYLAGLTPNPCVRCNRLMKFGYLFDRMRKLGYSLIASGHYAKVEYDGEGKRYLLRQGKDKEQDQSYFLFELSQEQLAHLILPLGELTKNEVRKIAEKEGLPVSDKRDSQEICFVPGNRYTEVVEKHSERKDLKGEIVDTSGRVLGYHRGIYHYTIGQRRGLGVALGEPLYVIEIDPVNNRIVVGSEEHLLKKRLIARDINLIALPKIPKGYPVIAKIRYKHRGEEAILNPLPEGRMMVEFKNPVRAITPGQAVVFYEEDIVIGGGWIEKAF